MPAAATGRAAKKVKGALRGPPCRALGLPRPHPLPCRPARDVRGGEAGRRGLGPLQGARQGRPRP
eukprot:9456060-Lingulodinium_polyedra.AAC.1